MAQLPGRSACVCLDGSRAAAAVAPALIVDEWSEQFVQLPKFILLSQVQVLRYLCHSKTLTRCFPRSPDSSQILQYPLDPSSNKE
jgi:hypothetical protein